MPGSRHIVILLLIIMNMVSMGQNSDSLINALKDADDIERTDICNELFLLFEFSDTLLAKTYIDKAVKYAKTANYTEGLINAYTNTGFFHEDRGDYLKAIDFYTIAMNEAASIGNKSFIASNHKNIGNVHLRQGSYPEAISSYQSALRIAEETGDKDLTSKCLANIGSIYLYQENYDKAIQFYSRAIDISEELHDIRRKANCLNNLGLAYQLKSELGKSVVYFNDALALLLELDDKGGLADCYHNLGVVYSSDKDSTLTDFKLSLTNFEKALTLYKEIGDKKGISLCYNSLGTLFARQKDFQKSLEYSQKSLDIAKEIGSKDAIKGAYQEIANSYKQLGNYEKAFEYLYLFSLAKDSLYIEKSIQLQGELEAKYENEKKQKEIELKNIELAKKDAVVKQKTTFQYALIIVISLILVFFIFLYNSYRHKKKANELLSLQKLEIEEKNKDITNSIKYAKRIQESILPPDRLFRDYLPESFVFYRPKDIVSGDFYWIERKGFRTLFAVVDCTGHGVPGAFISIIGHNGLNRAVNEFGLTRPGEILNKLNEIVNETIRQTYEDSTIRDGMDIALCSLDTQNMELEYAGAHNPLYLLRDNNIIEFAPDKRPIGHFIGVELEPFSTTKIPLKKNDIIYIFSDGYADQFGGPDNKKFKYSNFKNLLISCSGNDMGFQMEKLDRTLTDWMKNLSQIDDICVIGTKIT